MATVSILLLIILIENSLSTHCDKELNYHDNYGYGIDITCEDLSDETSKMLTRLSVSNEFELNINNSNLTNVTTELFKNVSKIKYFTISNSTFLFDPSDEIFINFTKLEHLAVENTKFNNLNSHAFRGLDQLKELNLSNCSLKIIKNDTLKMMHNLETLKLSRNQFRSLFDIPFCELPGLKILDLDHNHIQQIEDHFLVCFQKEEESGFKLNGRSYEITYHKNDLYHQTKSNFDFITLDLSHNQISSIGLVDWAPRLKTLDLSHNRLNNISDNVFIKLTELTKLHLDNNLLEKIDEMAFANLGNLTYISLRNNNISEIFLRNLTNLEKIYLSNNKLVWSSLGHLRDLPKLKELVLVSNEFRNFTENTLNFSSLEILDLSNNQIVLKQGFFKTVPNLRHLSLRQNNLKAIPVVTLNLLSKLESLDISVNKLGPVINLGTFNGLESLEILNMSYNNIEYLSYELLKPLHNLQVLDISGNRLQNFQISLISLLPSLRVINIKSNFLSCSTLSTIITFLKSKEISFSINEEFKYDRQNVDGIYCEEISERLIENEESENRGVHLSSAVGILFIVVASSVCFAFMLYKCLLYSRRRRYRMDEMELL